MIHSLLEIVNAILVAYFATEVLLSRGDDRRDQQLDLISLLKQRRVKIVGGIWLSTNVLTAVLLHISSTPSVYRLSRRFLVPLVVLVRARERVRVGVIRTSSETLQCSFGHTLSQSAFPEARKRRVNQDSGSIEISSLDPAGT